MKKALLALAITVCALAQAVYCLSEENKRDEYRIYAKMLEDEQAFSISAAVSCTNRTGEALDGIMFFLPANSFRRESTLPYDNDTLEKAFAAGYAPAGAEISAVMVNGESAEWAVRGENECYLRVECALLPGETCEISFAYTLLLSENRAFLGSGSRDWRLTGFYPSVCVFEDGDFCLNPVSRVGKSHYSEVCDYYLLLDLPADYDAACAGGADTAAISGGRKICEASVRGARELALCVSRKFHKVERTSASGVRVTAFGQERRKLADWAEEAASAIDYFSEKLGAYPYESLTLVESELAGDSLYATGILLLSEEAVSACEYEIARLVAIQYLGEYVQPNPYMEAWLSDALGEYLAVLYIRDTAGEKAYKEILNKRLLPAVQITVPGGLTPLDALSRFQTRAEYEAVVRLRGAAAMHEVRLAMGEETFFHCLRAYINEFAGKTPVSDDFVRSVSASAGRDFADAIYGWLYTIGDYGGGNLYEYD